MCIRDRQEREQLGDERDDHAPGIFQSAFPIDGTDDNHVDPLSNGVPPVRRAVPAAGALQSLSVTCLDGATEGEAVMEQQG